MDSLQEIKNLGAINLQEISNNVSKDEFVHISQKMQKHMINLNIRVKDLESSIKGYEVYSNKYFRICKELKKLPDDINQHHLIKVIIGLL